MMLRRNNLIVRVRKNIISCNVYCYNINNNNIRNLHYNNILYNPWNKQYNSVEEFIHSHAADVEFTDVFDGCGPTKETNMLWKKCLDLSAEELSKGILGVDNKIPASITSHEPGYIDKNDQLIVGLQTDAPLKRGIKPFGGWRTVKGALESYGYKMDEEVERIFKLYRKTHNDGVFDAYTPEMLQARKQGILTGLPDAYGRGRIIGDYRRVALYGVDELIAKKKADKVTMLGPVMDEETIRLREEVSEQIRALEDLKVMANSYGFDISKPAKNANEAIQWTYFGYLGSVKEQDGAAMSFGRVDPFFEPYIKRDIESGVLTEESAQELIDRFVMKLRLVRHLRTPEYNELFAGDPTWVTCVLGGATKTGQSLVSKTTYRLLQTLYNLGPSPEPNLTVLWCKELPENFKRFCSKVSIDTSSIQYENDALMRSRYGSDYGIACCVSAMAIGQQMQFFGARCNLAKLLLYAINGGVDEVSGVKLTNEIPELKNPNAPLDYDEIIGNYKKAMNWLAGLYANTMNCIHFMHDKYSYERLQMALHDTHVTRFMAYGVAGLSVVADSLSAIKYAKVEPIRDERGLATDFKITGEFPKYGNYDENVDKLAQWSLSEFMDCLRQHKTYRQSIPTLSVLTITSNVVYGKKTGSTPDGRKIGEPFAPGANPLHGRDSSGAIASLSSVATLPYDDCRDGISNTFSIVPTSLGKGEESQIENLVSMLDGYFEREEGLSGHHLNVNVYSRETLKDAMEHPEKYPTLTIRVSGYAVKFTRLSREQQLEVISRTFHQSM